MFITTSIERYGNSLYLHDKSNLNRKLNGNIKNPDRIIKNFIPLRFIFVFFVEVTSLYGL